MGGGLRWSVGFRQNLEDRRFDPPAVRSVADGVDGERAARPRVSLLKVKRTVRPFNLWIVCAVINAANVLELGADMLITSGMDGKHMKGSKHYTGDALDIRTQHLSAQDRGKLIAAIRRRLGPGFDLVLEQDGKSNEHLHIERDPA